MDAIIPSKASRKQPPRALDKDRYKARHMVENLFQKMKVIIRVATRFEKPDCMLLGFVHLAAIKHGSIEFPKSPYSFASHTTAELKSPPHVKTV